MNSRLAWAIGGALVFAAVLLARGGAQASVSEVKQVIEPAYVVIGSKRRNAVQNLPVRLGGGASNVVQKALKNHDVKCRNWLPWPLRLGFVHQALQQTE